MNFDKNDNLLTVNQKNENEIKTKMTERKTNKN